MFACKIELSKNYPDATIGALTSVITVAVETAMRTDVSTLVITLDDRISQWLQE